MANRCVYFAVTDDSLYPWMAHQAIGSLCKFNKSLSVRLVVFGDHVPSAAEERWAELDVQVLTRDPCDGSPYEVKWHALRDMADQDDVLWLDADVVCNGDVEELFDRYSSADFWAREWPPSRSAGPNAPAEDIWAWMRENIDVPLWDRLRRDLALVRLPIFATGLMLFRGGVHRKVVEALPAFSTYMDGFSDGTLPYPCANAHVREQFAASMMLGGVPGLTWGLVDDSDTPEYPEVRTGQQKGPGLVLQVITTLYPQYLRDAQGPEAAQAFLDQFGTIRRFVT